MSNIEKHEQTTALSITDDQTEFNDRQVAVLNQIGVQGANRGDLAVFFHQVKRTGLDPFARQIYMISRQGKQTIQTGIDGFRLIARRATDRDGGALGYEETLWCGQDGQWMDVWLSDQPPAAAKVTVTRNGERFPAVALLSEYVGLRFNKKTGQQEPNTMWRTKPALMLAKCAEALALRKAFPQDLSGIYTSDEMQQADNHSPQQQPQPQRSVPQPPAADDWAARLEKLEQAGEVGKVAANMNWARDRGHGELFEMARGVHDRMLAAQEPAQSTDGAEGSAQSSGASPSPQEAQDNAQQVLDAEVVEDDRHVA